MKQIFVIFSVCLVVVNCQSVRPPRPPPSNDPMGTPVPMPPAAPTDTPTVARVSPPRPKGCSPGCGPTEICAELGSSYCRNGACSVCIKMSSIRFPASALAAMFSQQSQPAPAPQPVVPAQPVVQPPANPFNASPSVSNGQVSDTEPIPQDQTDSETQISILEYAAMQRSVSKENGVGKVKSITKPPPPPPPPSAHEISYQVSQENGKLDSSATAIEINNVQDVSTQAVQQQRIDPASVDTQRLKYPILVTVTDNTSSVDAPNQVNFAQTIVVNGNTSTDDLQSHVAHIDYDQMAKWYQQYQTFRDQQAKPKQGNATNTSQQKADTFDYATFQSFQTWLLQHQQQTNVLKQSETLQSSTTPAVQPPTPSIGPIVQPQTQPLITGAPPNVPIPVGVAQQTNALDFNSLQQQYNRWLLQQQLGTGSATPQPVAINPVTLPAVPVAQVPVQPQNALDFASMQQQFIQWQQQQQQRQQQNHANAAASQTQINAIVGNVPQTQAPSPTLDFATFQTQYQQWQQDQAAKISQNQHVTTSVSSDPKPATPAPPQQMPVPSGTFDFAAFQNQYQQWQRDQANRGQAQAQLAPAPVQSPNIAQQSSSQEIQTNVLPNPQASQQQNTFTYMPQQPVNTFNDPFFYDFTTPQQNTFSNNFNPPSQNNNLMDLMVFSSLGFGGGLFAF